MKFQSKKIKCFIISIAIAATGVFTGVATAQNEKIGARLAVTKLPARGDFVIRGAYVMTMDDQLGDIKRGDVHFSNGKIIAVGEGLNAGSAKIIPGKGMVLMPGLIDSHTHLWTTQMRGNFGDTPEKIYFRTRNTLGDGFQARDMYYGTRMGAAEAVYSGITMVMDFNHNARGEEFVRESLKGIAETGLRARFLYGATTIMKPTESIDLALMQKMATSWSAFVGDAPITLGLAWRGPLGIMTPLPGEMPSPSLSIAREEIDTARRLGLPISTHVSGNQAQRQFQSLIDGKFLGKDLQLIHMSNLPPEQIKIAADAGSSIALTPITELRVGYGLTNLSDFINSGAKVGIGIDSNSLAGTSDMFSVMKLFQMLEAGRTKNELAITPRKLLRLATIEGAQSLNMGDQIGSITPGKNADMIMINMNAINIGMFAEDPAHLIVEAVRPENIDTVVIDGRILKRNGRLTAINVTRIVNETTQSITEIVNRTKK